MTYHINNDKVLCTIGEESTPVARFCKKRRVYIMFHNKIEHYKPDLVQGIRIYESKAHHDNMYNIWHYPVCARVFYKNGLLHSEFLMNRKWKNKTEKNKYFYDLFDTIVHNITTNTEQNVQLEALLMIVYERTKYATRLSLKLDDEYTKKHGYLFNSTIGSVKHTRSYKLYATKVFKHSTQ
jgi:hypothetical protein